MNNYLSWSGWIRIGVDNPKLNNISWEIKFMNKEIKNKIICGDCIEGMKMLPSNSFDIVIADPPYNIGKNFGNNFDNYSF